MQRSAEYLSGARDTLAELLVELETAPDVFYAYQMASAKLKAVDEAWVELKGSQRTPPSGLVQCPGRLS